MNIILGDELKYGSFDGLRLELDEMGESGFIAYNPEHIGRGISVQWTVQEKEKITLRSLTPQSPDETRDFFAAIERICNYWKCELEVDSEKQSAKEFSRDFPSFLTLMSARSKHFSKTLFREKQISFPCSALCGLLKSE